MFSISLSLTVTLVIFPIFNSKERHNDFPKRKSRKFCHIRGRGRPSPPCLFSLRADSEVSALLAMALTSPAWQPARFSLQGKVFLFYSNVGGRTSLGRVCSGCFLPDRFYQAGPQQMGLFFSRVYLGVAGRIKFRSYLSRHVPHFWFPCT